MSKDSNHPQGKSNGDPSLGSFSGDSQLTRPIKQNSPQSIRILGIDPGSQHTGYGLVDFQESKLIHLDSGRISPKSPIFSLRLKYIFEQLKEIISHHEPVCMVLEEVFTYKNPNSAIKLAQARGVAILCGSLYDLPVFEYSTSQVKNSVCGYGRAEKTQVAFMTGKILNITETLPPDASDALALAICHAGFVNIKNHINSKCPKKSGNNKSFRKLSVEDLTSMGFKISDK